MKLTVTYFCIHYTNARIYVCLDYFQRQNNSERMVCEPAEANKRKFVFNKLEDLNFGGATSISAMSPVLPFSVVNGNFNYSTLSSDYLGP